MSKTLEYYNANARQFCESTRDVDFSQTQNRFLELLPPHARILDFGCGSGRDTRYFLERGFRVDATDGSSELCRIASGYAGVAVRQMLFEELDVVAAYDGVWACSSILHVPKAGLPRVLRLIERALVPGGVLYTSFKYGEFDAERKGRHFSNYTEETFSQLIAQIEGLEVESWWVSGDVRPGRSDERWLNLIIRKTKAE